MESFVAPEQRVAEGFVLRCYRPGDGPKLCSAATASYEHLKTFMDWARPDQTEEESEQLARRFRAKWLLAEDFVIGIWAPDDAELLGGCGFHLREGGLEQRNAEIGMWIAASRAGQGLGTRALVELIDWGFAQWPWLRLTWRCDTTNLASIRLAEKAGMRLEGTLKSHMVDHHGERRDTACHAILKQDWEAAAAAPPPRAG